MWKLRNGEIHNKRKEVPMYAVRDCRVTDAPPVFAMNDGQILLFRVNGDAKKERAFAEARKIDRAKRFSTLSLVFFSVSFLGWCLEVVYCSSGFTRFCDRGFLSLPFCVIYGTPLCLVYLILGAPQEGRLRMAISRVRISGVKEKIVCYTAYFLFSALLATAFELIFGALFDRLGKPLWDYSDMPLNFKGYICPVYSLAWGALITLAMSTFFKPLLRAFSRLPSALSLFLSGTLWIAVILDFGLNFSLLLLTA
ncbi:MAG: putative ABC transporter permease [Clostridia bacterium]|nr:putative ABC transporter permease [Clostridia bacterium]